MKDDNNDDDEDDENTADCALRDIFRDDSENILGAKALMIFSRRWKGARKYLRKKV